MKKILEVLFVVIAAFLLFAAGVYTESRVPILSPTYGSAQIGVQSHRLQPVPPGAYDKRNQGPKNKGQESKNGKPLREGDDRGGWNMGKGNGRPGFPPGFQNDRGPGGLKLLAIPIFGLYLIFSLLVLGLAVWGGVSLVRSFRQRRAASKNVVANPCQMCGKPLQKGWKLCPFCGTEIGDPESSPESDKPAPDKDIRSVPKRDVQPEPGETDQSNKPE